MSRHIDSQVRRLALDLWNYHSLRTELAPSDFVLAMGSHDERVAVHAAELVRGGMAPVLVVSGGFGKVTRELWGTTEAERFAHVAVGMGIDEAAIVIEPTATNTGENVTRTRDLLAKRGLPVRRAILVTKPYMRRRAYATAARQWPEVEWLVSAPDISFDDYPVGEVTEERMIELMVGDLQRIKVYGEKGLQLSQEVPEHVWKSYRELVSRGFDRFLLRE